MTKKKKTEHTADYWRKKYEANAASSDAWQKRHYEMRDLMDELFLGIVEMQKRSAAAEPVPSRLSSLVTQEIKAAIETAFLRGAWSMREAAAKRVEWTLESHWREQASAVGAYVRMLVPAELLEEERKAEIEKNDDNSRKDGEP